MAEQLLKAWNARPVVTDVTIDAAGRSPKVKSAAHATVTDLSNVNGVSWTELDDALPLPFHQWDSAPFALVLRSSNVAQDLNDESLRVTGLKSGVYSLKIDGTTVGAFNNDELSSGINLALLDTPMSEQAKQVYDLTVAHCDVHNVRWRTMQVPLAQYDLPATQPAMQSADALETALIQKRREAAKPKPHKFELVGVS
jgi:hypothetical protein